MDFFFEICDSFVGLEKQQYQFFVDVYYYLGLYLRLGGVSGETHV
jgi:hypothetical protein